MSRLARPVQEQIQIHTSDGGKTSLSSDASANGFGPRPRNKWVRKSSSAIHGGGLFARRSIPAGTRVIEYVGTKLTKRQSAVRAIQLLEKSTRSHTGAVYIFELNRRYDVDGSVRWNLARFINHSCEPNCESRTIRGHIWIIALRDIDPGQELTYDYGYEVEHWKEHPCQCGSPLCVGYIVRRDQWPSLKRRLARKKTPSPDDFSGP